MKNLKDKLAEKTAKTKAKVAAAKRKLASKCGRARPTTPALIALALIAAILLGCSTATPTTVYIPTDRKIESCTNSLGYACKAVPDPVFAEMLLKLQELKDLQNAAKVDARLK